jgi:hypothetical protein
MLRASPAQGSFALPILFERSNATATLWNIEIVVVLAC